VNQVQKQNFRATQFIAEFKRLPWQRHSGNIKKIK